MAPAPARQRKHGSPPGMFVLRFRSPSGWAISQSYKLSGGVNRAPSRTTLLGRDGYVREGGRLRDVADLCREVEVGDFSAVEKWFHQVASDDEFTFGLPLLVAACAMDQADQGVLDELFQALKAEAVEAGGPQLWSRQREALVDAFLAGLSDAELLGELSVDEAAVAGERAAAQLVAGLRWSSVVGQRLDTQQVGDLLGVTRQALAKRQRSGSLLGLPGQSTTWFPTWQFDFDARSVRPEVRQLIGAFRDRLEDDFDPILVASWASTEQSDDLDGLSPARWLAEGRDPEHLVVAADRAAARLAQ